MPERTLLLELKDARTLAMPGARLLVLKGPDKGRARPLDREEIVVGTSPAADLVLTDPTVSRNHASLRVTEQGYLLTDLGSSNGTRLDGRRVLAAYLAPGDVLEVGATRIRLQQTKEPVSLALSEEASFGRLVGQSVAARRLFATLTSLAQSEVTVLFLGETGTGKDAAAGALHERGARAAQPFVVFDCGAINPSLIESALFGHEVGAFTGATSRRAGVFEEAHGGTLFLDEIGELPRALQPKLLRALEQREVRRLGASSSLRVDVRVIAATNRELARDVNRGLFREDLYYRLNVVTVRIPPLRERAEDVPLLARHFWRALTADDAAEPPQAMLDTFSQHVWPGNVRELRNRVERALATNTSEITGLVSANPTYKAAKAAAMAAFARVYFSGLLARAGNNVSEAARQAQMDRVHLIKLLREYELTPR